MEELLLLINPIIDFLTNNPEGIMLGQYTFGPQYTMGPYAQQSNQPTPSQQMANTQIPPPPTFTQQQSPNPLNNPPPPQQKKKAVDPTGSAWGDIATGVTNTIMSFVGKKRKRDEQKAANREHNLWKNKYQQLDTSNPFSQLENPYEDLTVNQQQAEFQAQQEQQGMANTMQSLQGAAGGSGIAGLAQALSNQQSRNLQRASADIGQQERQNMMTKSAFTSRRQEQGVVMERQMKREQAETMFGMSQQRKAAADEAEQGIVEGLVGGLNQIGAGVGGLFMPQGS